MQKRPLSIRRMLIGGVITTTVAVLCVSALISYSHSAHEIDEVFDAELAQASRLTQALLADHADLNQRQSPLILKAPLQDNTPHQLSSTAERGSDGHKYEQLLAVQVHDQQGRLLLTSEHIGQQTLAPLVEGYHHMQRLGQPWICFVLWDDKRQVWITTAQQQHARQELSWYLVEAQLMPLIAALLPLLLLLVSVMLKSLSPLSTLAERLRRTKPSALTPITTPLPDELQPIQNAINDLLQAIDKHLQQERRFIADASHELRTPLATLQLHCQLLKDGRSNAEDAQYAIAAIDQSSRQLHHLVEQLLNLARLEQQGLQLTLHNCGDLQDLVAQALARLDNDTMERVEWQLQLAPDLQWQLETNLFVSLLRNVLDNAARYAPAHAIVTVHSYRQDQSLCLEIRNTTLSDPLDLTRLGERFYRGQGQQHLSGSGLGISIVQRIAQLQQLQLEWRCQDGEFVVVVRQTLASHEKKRVGL